MDNQELTQQLKNAAIASGVMPDCVSKAVEAAAPSFYLSGTGMAVVRGSHQPADIYFAGVFKSLHADFYSKGGTVTRSDFDSMSPADRAAHIKAGGRVVN